MGKPIDTTPLPAFLRGQQNQKWTVAGALSELVDNSLGSGRGNADTVTIFHDTTHRVLSVLDNGVGMDAVGRLFQLGNTIGRSPGDIGLYGQGGTLAILWLPQEVKVYTMRNGMVSSYRMKWQEQFEAAHYFAVPDDWETATLANTPPKLLEYGHGTMIMAKLLPGRSFHASNVIRDLARTYAPAVRNGKIITWRTISGNKVREERSITDPFPLKEAVKTITFDITIEIDGDHLPVHGCIGIVEDLPHVQSVVSVGYGHRTIITTRDCYQSSDGDRRYAGTGVTGWLELGEGWQPYLATTKDAIHDQRAWDALMSYVFAKIEPLLKETEDDQFRIILDDIAMNLQLALNANINIEMTQEGTLPPGGRGSHGDETVSQPSPGDGKHPLTATEKDGEDAEKRQPATSELVLVRLSDREMQGALCSVEMQGDESVMGMINRDHECIQEALKAKPVNRMALNYMVTRELAGTIRANPKMMRRLFKPSLLRQIDEREEEIQERYIARILMDRVRTPVSEDAA